MRHELTTLSMRKELYLLLLLDVGPQWAGSWHMSSHTRANVSKHASTCHKMLEEMILSVCKRFVCASRACL